MNLLIIISLNIIKIENCKLKKQGLGIRVKLFIFHKGIKI
jgi:hypothetical protein